MDNKNFTKLNQEYEDNHNRATKMANEVLKQINEIIYSSGVTLAFPIQYRVKSWDSLREKITRNSLKLNSIFDLQDLVGHRIIIIFKRDVDKILELLSKKLTILKEYDTNERLMNDQFGYSSYHIVASVPKEWLKVPSMQYLDGIKTEIQIRTISQHLWAEVSHKLQYKNESSVPKLILRSVFRTSALLEIIDLEFERVLIEREKYRQKIEEEGSSVDQDAELNVDLLEQILDTHLPELNKGENEDLDRLLQDLTWFEINTVKRLNNFIDNNIEAALDAEKFRLALEKKNIIDKEEYAIKNSWLNLQRLRQGCFYMHTGLIRKMLENEFKEEWSKYQVDKINEI